MSYHTDKVSDKFSALCEILVQEVSLSNMCASMLDSVFLPNLGSGMYIYIETSIPRIPGDTARLQSPWMRGPQCMTFFYHMYGSTMSCVVIYIKRLITNRLKPVWLRSQNRGNRWIRGQISINETASYQVSCEMSVKGVQSLYFELFWHARTKLFSEIGKFQRDNNKP